MQQRLKDRKNNRRRAADVERRRQAEEEEMEAMDINVAPRVTPPPMMVRSCCLITGCLKINL
jgi:hypothetical protein